MIRSINIANLFYQSNHFYKKCRIVSCALSTSFVCQGEKLNRPKITNAKQEVVDESSNNYGDTFGNLENFEMKFQRIKDDPEDVEEYLREKAGPGLTMQQYLQKIKYHLGEYDYKSAVKLFEVDMVNDKKPRVTLVYKILMNYNAKIGNLDETYRLYLMFKKRQGIVVGAMYTILFNACANCKNSELALKRATSVNECMRNNKHHRINVSNYNAMLKAYGRHGDLLTCLKIVDEVFEQRDKIKSETFNFLLQACLSDKNSGLRHALIIWRKMLQYRAKVNIFSFNVILKCVRDCSLGDASTINCLIDDIKKESEQYFKRKVIMKRIGNEVKRTVLKIPVAVCDPVTPTESQLSEPEEKMHSNFITLESHHTNQTSQLLLEDTGKNKALQTEIKNSEEQLNNLELNKKNDDSSQTIGSFPESTSEIREPTNPSVLDVLQKESEIPNFLSKQISTGAIVEFGVITKPNDRFALVGGVEGFLKVMNEFKVYPDLKTFSLMLELIPSTSEAEKNLMLLIEKYNVKFDTTFFNILIKRRILRFETSKIRPALEEMFSLDLKPDIITFGILAMSCSTLELAKDLLKTLDNYGFKANTAILETLLKNAAFTRDLNYVYAILQKAKEDETELSPRFVAKLSDIVKKELYFRKKSENQLKNPEDREEMTSELGRDRNQSNVSST